MFTIGEAIVEDDIGQAAFCCNLPQCHGACCYIAGGRGAPLEDAEVFDIVKAYPAAKRYLSDRSLDTIARLGLYEGVPGSFATTCVEERECVFAYFENLTARCSFERTYHDGNSGWRKPISCHLFPIRIRKSGKDYIRYEQIDECRAGREQGKLNNVPLHEFLREPLTRNYGEAWYDTFLRQCRTKGL